MEFKDILNGIMIRHGLSKTALSVYLGCPVQTAHKWLSGDRQPSAAVLRLVDVLLTIETLAPEIHNHLLPDKRKG